MRRGPLVVVAAAVAVSVAAGLIANAEESPIAPRRDPSPAVLVGSADVPAGPTQPPLPRSHPTVVDPVAGETASPGGEAGFAPPDNAPPAASAAGSGAGPSPGAPSDAEVRAELASLRQAQKRAGGAYVNPLARASVTPERIDMGVDYAGRGPLLAIGAALITGSTRSSGWPGGGWVSYRLLDGSNAGRTVFYAEGIVPSVRVNQVVAAGQPVAVIIPGSSPGIEIGWAGEAVGETYARAFGGGYSEGARTAAGQAFSDFIQSLGAPPGLAGGRPITGRYS